MANWYGTSRSNFVRVKDVDAAIAALEPFYNTIHRHPSMPDYIMISGSDDDGSFSTTSYDHETGNELALDFGQWASEHLVEGQILVLISAGAEKLRYVSAYAEAYNHNGEYVGVNLSSALDAAIKATFGDVPYAAPEYQEVA